MEDDVRSPNSRSDDWPSEPASGQFLKSRILEEISRQVAAAKQSEDSDASDYDKYNRDGYERGGG